MSQYDRSISPTMGARQPVAQSHVRQKAPGPVRKFIRTPKGAVLFLLLGLMLIASIHVSDRPGVVNIAPPLPLPRQSTHSSD